MGAKIILCLKLLENMIYIRGLQTFLAQGPQKDGHGSAPHRYINFTFTGTWRGGGYGKKLVHQLSPANKLVLLHMIYKILLNFACFNIHSCVFLQRYFD